MAAPKNPAGAKSDKLWRNAILRAVRRSESGQLTSDAQRLDQLADVLVERGLTGDSAAYREIGNRLDGRPHFTAEIRQPTRQLGDYSDAELLALFEQSERAPRDGDDQAKEEDE